MANNGELQDVGVDALTEPTAVTKIEEVLKLVKTFIKAIEEKNEDSFNHHLEELQNLFPDEYQLKKLLDESGAMIWAAYARSNSMVQTLLQKGADIYAMSAMPEDPNMKTLIHWAARKGHVDVVQCLVENGANAAIKDERGFTPLHLAAEGGHVDTVKYLVENGVDINIKVDPGRNLVHRVCLAGDDEGVDRLLKRGAQNQQRRQRNRLTKWRSRLNSLLASVATLFRK